MRLSALSNPSAPELSNFNPGDRVGVPWIYSACGVCEYCASDREALCPSIVVTGFMVDGGYAEYLVLRPPTPSPSPN